MSMLFEKKNFLPPTALIVVKHELVHLTKLLPSNETFIGSAQADVVAELHW